MQSKSDYFERPGFPILALLTIGFALLPGPVAVAQRDARSATPAVTGNPRVDKLLHELTLKEKVSLIHGVPEPDATDQGEAGYMAGVPRLGIPPLRMTDGVLGLLTRVPATAPTCSMGIAATFSREDAQETGTVIARLAKARGSRLVLEPSMNIDRDIAFHMAYNSFGEDPLLSGEIAAAMIQGIEHNGVMADAKHYIGYASNRDNVVIEPQALHEIYIAPFVNAVQAGVATVMCGYTRVNGKYACGNGEFQNTILRDEIDFKGFLMSDWGANHGTTFINEGLDLEMPGPGNIAHIQSFFGGDAPIRPATEGAAANKNFEFRWDGRLPEEPPFSPLEAPAPATPHAPKTDQSMMDALRDGTVTEDTVTRAVARILLQFDRFGLLEHQQPLDRTLQLSSDTTQLNARTIEKTGEDAAVLLKNDNNALPLKKTALQSLALIGPGAAQTVAVGLAGEKSVGLPARQIGTLQVLKRYFPGSASHIEYAVADDLTGTTIPARYLSHHGKPGLERSGTASGTDPQIDFTRKNGRALPANVSETWSGTLTVPSTGNYRLHLQVLGCYGALWLDGKRLISNGRAIIHGDITQAGQDDVLPTTDGLDSLRVEVPLAAGEHKLYVSVIPNTSNQPIQVRLNWVTPEQRSANYAAAIAAARGAKTAVVFAWSRTFPTFALPGDQDRLIADIAAINPNTIVVLNVSQPIAMPWLDKVKAVLQMWWPGDEGGWATANILLGRANPAGRLPFTWGRSLQDYPATDPRYPERSDKGVDGKSTFTEGIFVGYRWFDKQQIKPLFPFGYGLSYTSFEYSHLHVSRAADGGLDVSFTVRNSGKKAGDEVPQVYLGIPRNAPASSQFAKEALAAFDRIHLAPGTAKNVSLHVPRRSLEYWSTSKSGWQFASGERDILVGSSSRDIKLTQSIIVAE
ncbi:MAG TPA: glycoside hydrolase family 3 C-terminal domain-containing protein [Alloacidobacterium sp.]|nr:glycoside hydrolase family 3 C-terminal domain-containing protein [Alloacidobacterium sp.]